MHSTSLILSRIDIAKANRPIQNTHSFLYQSNTNTQCPMPPSHPPATYSYQDDGSTQRHETTVDMSQSKPHRYLHSRPIRIWTETKHITTTIPCSYLNQLEGTIIKLIPFCHRNSQFFPNDDTTRKRNNESLKLSSPWTDKQGRSSCPKKVFPMYL